MFVRGGSIIPHQKLVQSTDETPTGPLDLDVYPGSDCSGSLYLDDGKSFACRKGSFVRKALTCSVGKDGSVSVTIGKSEGTFQPWWREFNVIVHGMSHQAGKAVLKGTNSGDLPIVRGDEVISVLIPARKEERTLIID